MLKYIKEYNQFKKGEFSDEEEDIWNDFVEHYENADEYAKNSIMLPTQEEINRGEISSDYIHKEMLIEFWGKLPLKIGDISLDKEEAFNLINESYTYYSTGDGIYGILDWINTYEKYTKDGGELYRIVFIKDLSDLNKDKLGNHWTYEEYVISDFYLEYMYRFPTKEMENKDPYILSVKIPPGLNLKMGNFDRPEEKEIFIPNEDQSKIELLKVVKVGEMGERDKVVWSKNSK